MFYLNRILCGDGNGKGQDDIGHGPLWAINNFNLSNLLECAARMAILVRRPVVYAYCVLLNPYSKILPSNHFQLFKRSSQSMSNSKINDNYSSKCPSLYKNLLRFIHFVYTRLWSKVEFNYLSLLCVYKVDINKNLNTVHHQP